MGLETVLKNVQDFIKESADLNIKNRQDMDKLKERLKAGEIGNKGYHDKVQQAQSDYEHSRIEKGDKLLEQLQQTHSEELQDIEDSIQSVTADNVAELDLLTKFDLKHGDLDEYVQKYKHTPLALKRLKMIASDKGIATNFPEDRKERLNVIIGRMENTVNKYKRFTDDYDVKINMKADGEVRGHAQDVSHYRSL